MIAATTDICKKISEMIRLQWLEIDLNFFCFIKLKVAEFLVENITTLVLGIKVMINKKVIFNFSHDLLYTYKFGSQLHEF